MSSSTPKNGDVQYPALSGTSGTSAESPNDSLVTGNNTQGSVNDTSARRPNDNAANQEPIQTSAATRQTRSAAKGAQIAFESLGPISELSPSQLREQQQYEIDRIINCNPKENEVLGQFFQANKAAITQVYKQLSELIDPANQPDEWKEKATRAQKILDKASEECKISIITPEVATDRPKVSHKKYWETTPFVGSVRRLQIDPSNQKAVSFIEMVNSNIEAENITRGYHKSCGKFPLKYLQDKYQDTQALRTKYKDTTDPEQKKELAAIFKALCSATEDFCLDRAFPQTWAWQYSDIAKEPPWLSEAEGAQPTSATGGDSSDNGPGTAGAAANEASPEGVNNPGTAGVAANEASPEGVNDPGTAGAATNGASPEGVNDPGTAGAATNGAGAEHGDTEIRDIAEALNKFTLDGEPIISKRKVFKDYQFLVEESSGLHVWKSAQLCGDLKPEDIPSVEKPTKEFITQHKHRYKGIRWIAMSIDDAITPGAGQYPRITVMVEWLGDLENTLMSRSDLIRIAGQTRVDRDLQNHLPYRKMIVFEGRQVFIMSQTDAGLLNGEMKAMQRIKNDQFKAAKANQTSFGQSALPQPGIVQPAVGQPAAPQPDVTQFVAQPAVGQPAIPQAGAPQPGFAQSAASWLAVPQVATTQPGIVQPAVGQPAAPQPGVAQLTQADMIPSSAVQAMIASAVQQAIQQYQRQSTPALAV